MSEELKRKLYQHCVDYVSERIEISQAAISQAQSAVTGETKNSAGDKYETERAMKQRETELFGRRLEEALKQQKTIQAIDISKRYDSVQAGALVETSIGAFFIAIGADEITVDGEEYCSISIESPIGQAMARLKAGDSFEFRGKRIQVETVC